MRLGAYSSAQADVKTGHFYYFPQNLRNLQYCMVDTKHSKFFKYIISATQQPRKVGQLYYSSIGDSATNREDGGATFGGSKSAGELPKLATCCIHIEGISKNIFPCAVLTAATRS